MGHDEGGQLTEQVRRRPYSVILLDEIEKAHPEVFNALLQILDDGRLTDGQGRTVDFKNTVVIMTSNVATPELRAVRTLASSRHIGVRVLPPRKREDAQQRARALARRSTAQALFRPEFLNRIDQIVVFHSTGQQELSQIVDLLLAQVRRGWPSRIWAWPMAMTCATT